VVCLLREAPVVHLEEHGIDTSMRVIEKLQKPGKL
jgi:hypothetical protein